MPVPGIKGNMYRLKRVALMLVFLAVCSAAEQSQAPSDWPRWLGADGTGASPAKNLLSEWPKEGPEILWRIPAGIGWSCPIIYDNRLYLTSLEDKTTEAVRCLDAFSGKEIWKYTYKVKYEKMEYGQGGPRAAPAATGKYLYTIGAMGNLFCFDRQTGRIIWERELDREYPTARRAWKGWNISPLPVGGKIIVNLGPDPEKNNERCVAFNFETGKVEWLYKSPVKIETTIQVSQTPQVTVYAGEKYILYSPYCRLSALRVSDGKPLWSYQLSEGKNTIATPLLFGDYILEQPFEKEQILLSVTGEAGKYNVKEVWKTKNSPSGNYSYTNYGGNLYGFASCFPLVCVSLAKGTVLWSKYGFKIDASLMVADGRLYIRSGRDLIIAEATPAGYKELSRTTFKIPVGNNDYIGWALPVIAHGNMYLRFSKELLCLNINK